MTVALTSAFKVSKNFTSDDKIHKAIEYLIQEHVVSVVSESKKYCYKTFNDKIGVVDIDFINDRVISYLY